MKKIIVRLYDQEHIDWYESLKHKNEEVVAAIERGINDAQPDKNTIIELLQALPNKSEVRAMLEAALSQVQFVKVDEAQATQDDALSDGLMEGML